MEHLIEIQNLSKAYVKSTSLAVDTFNLNIFAGEKIGVFGPNGAGKTTLISMMCGILKPDYGFVNYFIQNQKLNPHQALKYIGYVPQDFAFYPALTAHQNLTYFGEMYGINPQKLTEKIDFLLEKLGLNQVRHKKLSSFSGGMKRRINLAIGILNEPAILFLDEPTVGVDVQSKFAIYQLLDDLSRTGTTIVFTSHHLKESEDFCDRIALMDQGRIIELGSLNKLVKQYQVNDLETLLIQLTGSKLRDE